MKVLSRFPFMFAALLLGAIIAIAALCTDLDLISTGIAKLQSIQDRDVDDLFVALVLVVLGGAVDAVRNRRKFEIEAQRLETLKATMRTVQDLVGNALNNLILFRMEAEEHVSAEALKQFDDILQETAQKMSRLANLEVVVQKPMASGLGIEYESPK